MENAILFDHKAEVFSESLGVSRDRLQAMHETLDRLGDKLSGKCTKSEYTAQALAETNPQIPAELFLVGYMIGKHEGMIPPGL